MAEQDLFGDIPAAPAPTVATASVPDLFGDIAASDAASAVPEAPIVTATGNLERAQRDLGLTPQETFLYQHHLDNLNGNGHSVAEGPGKVRNPDGSISTIKNAIVGSDNKYYNVPTIWNGHELSPRDAFQRAQQVGLDKWPAYDSLDDADASYSMMHGFMEKDVRDFLQTEAQRQPAVLTKADEVQQRGQKAQADLAAAGKAAVAGAKPGTDIAALGWHLWTGDLSPEAASTLWGRIESGQYGRAAAVAARDTRAVAGAAMVPPGLFMGAVGAAWGGGSEIARQQLASIVGDDNAGAIIEGATAVGAHMVSGGPTVKMPPGGPERVGVDEFLRRADEAPPSAAQSAQWDWLRNSMQGTAARDVPRLPPPARAAGEEPPEPPPPGGGGPIPPEPGRTEPPPLRGAPAATAGPGLFDDISSVRRPEVADTVGYPDAKGVPQSAQVIRYFGPGDRFVAVRDSDGVHRNMLTDEFLANVTKAPPRVEDEAPAPARGAETTPMSEEDRAREEYDIAMSDLVRGPRVQPPEAETTPNLFGGLLSNVHLGMHYVDLASNPRYQLTPTERQGFYSMGQDLLAKSGYRPDQLTPAQIADATQQAAQAREVQRLGPLGARAGPNIAPGVDFTAPTAEEVNEARLAPLGRAPVRAGGAEPPIDVSAGRLAPLGQAPVRTGGVEPPLNVNAGRLAPLGGAPIARVAGPGAMAAPTPAEVSAARTAPLGTAPRNPNPGVEPPLDVNAGRTAPLGTAPPNPSPGVEPPLDTPIGKAGALGMARTATPPVPGAPIPPPRRARAAPPAPTPAPAEPIPPTAPSAAEPPPGLVPGTTEPPDASQRPPIPHVPISRANAITSRGQVVPIEYALVELRDLVPSHTDDLRETPGYPQDIQNRDRTRAGTELQIQNIINKFQPELLAQTADASNGAPIIGPDGIVESGNGRTMALRRAYNQGLPIIASYKDYLRGLGFPVDQMREPVLVRINRAPMTAAQRVQFAEDANRPMMLDKSPAEMAMADAKTLPDSVMDLAQPDDIMGARNRDFVRGILRSIASPNEIGGLIDANGALNTKGLSRVRGAILARAYGDPHIVATLVESTDGNYKAIGQALLEAAPMWSKMRSAVAQGIVEPRMDITANLVDAVNVIARARNEGRNVIEYVKQWDVFSGETLPPQTEAMLRWMLGGPDFTRRIGRTKIADAARFYAQEALKVPPGPALFGEATTPESLTEAARVRAEKKPDDEGPALLQREAVGQPAGAGAVRPGAGIQRAEESRPQLGAAGPRGTEGGARQVTQAVQLHPQIVGHVPLSPVLEPHLQAITEAVNRTLDRIAPGARRRAVARLEHQEGGPMAGAFYQVQLNNDLAHVIAWATDARDPVGTARHEAVHYLYRSGLLDDREWATLTKAARDGLWAYDTKIHPDYDGSVRGRYPDADEDLLTEEAIAEKFNSWRRAGGKIGMLPQWLRPIFAKIGLFLNQVAAAARRAFGRQPTWQDIFAKMERGEVGRRDYPGEYGYQEPAAQRTIKPTEDLLTPRQLEAEGQTILPGAEHETPEHAAARLRQQQKEEAELRMRGAKRPIAPQQPIRSGPGFEGTQDLFGAPPPKKTAQGTLFQRERPPEAGAPNPPEGRDNIDNIAEAIAGEVGGKPPGTLERTLREFSPGGATPRTKMLGYAFKATIFPRTLARQDTMSSRLWQAWKGRTAEQATTLGRWRDLITPTFTKLPAKSQENIYAAEEIARLKGITLKDLGPSQTQLVMENDALSNAAKSKPGDVIVLSPAETRGYFERRAMFSQAWRDFMRGTAKRFGWDGEPTAEAVAAEAARAPNMRDRKRLMRLSQTLAGIADHERAGYVPFMRFGDTYVMATPKAGKGGWNGEGFPPVAHFSLVDSETPWSSVFGHELEGGKVANQVDAHIAKVGEQFPADKYDIESGYLMRKPDILRRIGIPAIEKLMIVMEGNLKRELGASKKSGEMPPAVADNIRTLQKSLVDTLTDQMFDEMRAGFKKEALNVPGYSDDFGRATAAYMHGASQNIAEMIHRDGIDRAYQDIQDRHPSPALRQNWKDWMDDQNDVTNPLSRAANSLNQVAFYWTMAANVASSVKILLHSPQMAHATLAAGIGDWPGGLGALRAGRELYRALYKAVGALRIKANGIDIDPLSMATNDRERAFLKRMEDTGELHSRATDEMANLADTDAYVPSNVKRLWRRTLQIAASNISASDRMVRSAAALAGFRLAMDPKLLARFAETWKNNQVYQRMVEQGGVNPETVGHFLLTEAGGEWGRENALPAQRQFGWAGRLAFQFQQFRLRYLAQMRNLMTDMGPAGKAAAGLMATNLVILAGFGGLPFVGDIESGIDAIGRWIAHYDPMVFARIRNMIADAGLGKTGSEILINGPMSYATGVDLSSSLGFGDPITREAASSSSPIESIINTFPVSSIIYNATRGSARRYEAGQGLVAAGAQAAPAAIRNLARAAVVWPQQGVLSQSGRTRYLAPYNSPPDVPNQVSFLDLVRQGLGFSPEDYHRAAERESLRYQEKADIRNKVRFPHVGQPYPPP